jgi:hypothetical protein
MQQPIMDDVLTDFEQHGGFNESMHTDIETGEQPQMYPSQQQQPQQMFNPNIEYPQQQPYMQDDYETTEQPIIISEPVSVNDKSSSSSSEINEDLLDVSKYGMNKDGIIDKLLDNLKDPIIFFVIASVIMIPYVTYVITVTFPFTRDNVIYLVMIKALFGTLLFALVKMFL